MAPNTPRSMRLPFPRPLAALLIGLALLAGGVRTEVRADDPRLLDPPDDSRICAVLARAAEKALGIPEHLLKAVGVVESGRYDRSLGRAEPWPWTINAAGKGAVFAAKADAIAEVERLQRGGVSSIDVGCMQVNLAYHGDAFESLEDAFDPVMNVAYAAHFLSTLKEERGTWSAAVAAYHSSTPERGIPYRRKVAKTWHGLRGAITADAIKLRRAAVLETYRKRRAEFAEHQARVLKIQEERREARRTRRNEPAAIGVVALRGGLSERRGTAASPLPESGGVDASSGPGRRFASNSPEPSGFGRLTAACSAQVAGAHAGQRRGFDPALARQILEISRREHADRAFADDGFVAEPSGLFAEQEPWPGAPVEVLTAAAAPEVREPDARSALPPALAPAGSRAPHATRPGVACPRLIEQKVIFWPRRAKLPIVIRG